MAWCTRSKAVHRTRGGALLDAKSHGMRFANVAAVAKQRVVVIGNGMVGQRFLEQLAARSDAFELTAFCEEPRAAYDRVQLTSFFAGKTADDLSLAPKSFFQKTKATLRLNDAVQAIDPLKKVVR